MARRSGGGSPADIARNLKGVNFPAKKNDLVKQAKKNHAEEEVLESLKNLPEKEYGNMADVMKGYGQEHKHA